MTMHNLASHITSIVDRIEEMDDIRYLFDHRVSSPMADELSILCCEVSSREHSLHSPHERHAVLLIGNFEHLLRAADLLMRLAERINQASRQTPGELTEPLTRTERKVLSLMDSHLSYPEIAEQRSVSLNTIKTHRSNIFGKLGVGSRQEAVQRAKDLSLL